MSENGAGLPRAVILTAIPVEYQAVRAHLTQIHEELHPQGTVYERGIASSLGQSWDVMISEIGAGNPTAALEAERAIQFFQPTVILFVGVAGGRKDAKLGDVVAATKVYGYESGKAEGVFLPRPSLGRSTYRMEQRARAEAKKPDWLQRLKGVRPIPFPRVYVAPIAAGEKVVASTRSSLAEFLQAQYGEALAVEMEGYGFLQATYANSQVEALVIRGISDLIDGKREADAANFQELAAQHASAFAFEVLAKFDEGRTAQQRQLRFPTDFTEKGDIPDQTAEILAIVLEKIEEAWLYALTGKITDETWSKLKGESAQTVLRHALGAAIQRYATSQQRLDLARPLLEMDGFLTLPIVDNELTQLVRFEREPNAELIGQQWKASIDHPPLWCDFTAEAKRLLEYLRVELRSTEVFRPVFDAKSLDAIAASAATSTEALAQIEAQLARLAQLLTTHFGDLSREFARASFSIHEQILDYTLFIQEKTYNFVGRQFVFVAVSRFIRTHPRGYFFIRGDPGIGKSALAAQMVRTNGYIHHFNIRGQGINKPETFLKNICSQLIAVYHLNYAFLPPEASQDSGFLVRLLSEVSDKLGADQKVLIVIDALDEVDMLNLSPGTNTLYLPITLPQHIYVLITTRKISISLRIECEQDALDIEHDLPGNTADIREYIERAVGQPGIQAYIAAQGIDNELFINHLAKKSEGNFMYLRYILPDIENGAYRDLGLEALPVGLKNYYANHWELMRGKDKAIWFTYKLPIIVALTVVEEAVPIDLIADFSGIQQRAYIREVLHEWAQFLHEEQVLYKGNLQKLYRFYHASFYDFMVKQEEREDERVSLQKARKQIADNLLSKWLGDEE